MAVEIGALRALLSLDSAAFEKGAKRAQASMNKMQRSLTQAADNMRATGRKLTTRLTLPMAGLAGVAIKTSLSTVDAQAKLAQSLGTTTESMQVLARAGELAGVSTSGLEQLSKDLTRRLSQAASGTGPAVKALDRLGLSAGDLMKMPLDKRIATINDAIAEFVPAAEQAAVAGQLFGEEGSIAASRLDADTIRKATSEIERFGIAVTEVEADKIEEANDAISAIGLVTKGLANQITVALAPALIKIAETIADWGAAFNNLDPEMKKFIGYGAVLAAAIGPLAIGLGFVATGLAALASPLGLVVLGFGAVASAAIYVATQWDDLVARFPVIADVMTRVKDVFTAVWDGIKGIVQGAADVVNGAIQAIIGILTGDLTAVLDGLSAAWDGWVAATDAAINAVLNIIQAIVPGFSQVVADVIAIISALPGQLLEWGRAAIQSFVDGMLEKWGELKATVASIFSMGTIDAASVAGRGAARQAGTSAVQGLYEGVMSGAGSARKAGASAMGEVIGGAETKAEIQSPSRVFMRIGQQLMSGLGIGIQENTKIATDAIESGVEDMGKSLDGLGPKTDQVADKFAGMVTGIITGAQSIGDVLSQLGSNLLQKGISGLFSGIFGDSGGGGIGSLFAGLLDTGGNIPRGQFGIVGERGPEIVTGPAQVTSRAATAQVMGRSQAMAVSITMDESTGAMGAFVRDQAGQVVAQAAPRIVSQSVGATYKRAREVPMGR